MSETKELVYNKDHYTVIANDVVRGKQEMTLQEAKILRLVITQVAREDKDLKTYTCNIQELADFLSIDDSNLYRSIADICRNLIKRSVEISTGDKSQPWKMFNWIQQAEYDGKGNITLMLSEQIKPFVLDLNQYFTQYQLSNILEMSSFYAIRLYELLKTDEFKRQTKYEYSIEFLRQFFDCNNKHKKMSDFRRYVIDIAIKEINTKSDLYIDDVEWIKKGRKYDKVIFHLQLGYFYGFRRNLSETKIKRDFFGE